MSEQKPQPPEDLFRLVIEETADFAILLVDPSGSRVSLWNKGAERTFGFPASEMIGSDPDVIFTPEDRAAGVPARELALALKNGRAIDRRWHVRKDGTLFFAESVMTSLMRDGELAGFAKVCSDATERYLSEQRLGMDIELHEILSGDDSVAATLTAVLEKMCGRFGWSAGSLWEADTSEGMLRCSSVWHKDATARAFMEAHCDAMILNRGEGVPGEVWEAAAPIWLRDLPSDHRYARVAEEFGMSFGLAFPLLFSGEVLGVVEFFSQSNKPPREEAFKLMTVLSAQLGTYLERTHTAAQLSETRQRYRVIAETAQDAIFTIDETSTILFANTAAERLFGYGEGELRGRHLRAIMPERFRAAHDHGLSRYAATGRRNIPWTGVELPGLHRDGSEIPLEISFGESGDEGRRIFTGFARDIRERKRIEADRERLLADSEAANRSKDIFLAMVSHELRTPVTSILGWLEIMEEDKCDEKTFAMALAMIRNSAGMQAQLVEDILDVSRVVLGKLRLDRSEIELGPIVHAATQSLMPSAQAKQIAVAEFLAPGIRVSGDASRLQQVVWNLLSNAIKFTPEGGRVAVRLALRGDEIELTVSDTGPGISGELLEQLFDPFRQAEGSPGKGGLGLGLAIVKQIVELHGGTVSVESDGTGTGAIFTVLLPVSGTMRKDR